MKKFQLVATLLAFALTSCGGASGSSTAPATTESPSVPSISPVSTSADPAPSDSSSAHSSSSAPQGSSSATPSSSSSQEGQPGIEYDYHFETLMIKDEEGERLDVSTTLTYQDDFFLSEGTTFNKGLALMSFAASTMSGSKTNALSYYQAIGFDSIVHSPDYDEEETKDTILYNLAHKSINGSHVIALSISSSHNYKLPWLNNFLIGKTGNATGYQSGSDTLKAALNDYLAAYEGQPIKLWFSGYSRSAALLNILASELLEDEVIAEENLYCYLFETPRVVDAANAQAYPSIHNVINRNDPIQTFFPEAYGLARAGVDIDIYDSEATTICSEFDSRLVLPEFMPIEDAFVTDAEFIQFLLNTLLVEVDEQESDTAPDMHNRDSFVDNHYQEWFGTLIATFMSMSDAQVDALVANVQASPFSVLQTDGLYNLVKEQLDAEGTAYDDQALKDACNGVVDFIVKDAGAIAMLALSSQAKNNVQRVAYFHSVEFVIPLLLNYQASQDK